MTSCDKFLVLSPVQKVFPNGFFFFHLVEILYLPKESGEITQEYKVLSTMLALLQAEENLDKSKFFRKSDFVTSFT